MVDRLRLPVAGTGTMVRTGLGGMAASTLIASFLAGFAALWAVVSTHPALDRSAVAEVHPLAIQPFLERARELTLLGGSVWMAILTGLAVLLFAVGRYWREAAGVALSVIGTQIAIAAVKLTVSRPRPRAVDATDHASGFSFPSGHSATSLAFYGSVALLVAYGLSTRARIVVWSTAGSLVAAIGATRVYLGVHYPTDVLAGWLLAAAILTGVWATLLHRHPNRFRITRHGARIRSLTTTR